MVTWEATRIEYLMYREREQFRQAQIEEWVKQCPLPPKNAKPVMSEVKHLPDTGIHLFGLSLILWTIVWMVAMGLFHLIGIPYTSFFVVMATVICFRGMVIYFFRFKQFAYRMIYRQQGWEAYDEQYKRWVEAGADASYSWLISGWAEARHRADIEHRRLNQ